MFERHHVALAYGICYRHEPRNDVRLGAIHKGLRRESSKNHVSRQEMNEYGSALPDALGMALIIGRLEAALCKVEVSGSEMISS